MVLPIGLFIAAISQNLDLGSSKKDVTFSSHFVTFQVRCDETNSEVARRHPDGLGTEHTLSPSQGVSLC